MLTEDALAVAGLLATLRRGVTAHMIARRLKWWHRNDDKRTRLEEHRARRALETLRAEGVVASKVSGHGERWQMVG